MPQRSVATNFTFEQQRQEINLLAADFWTHKTGSDTAAPTYLKHDGSNDFTGQTLAVPNAFTINSNGGAGTVTISGNLDVTGTTTTVSSANLEVTDKNILIAKGSTSDSQADGAGITIDSATDITFNFVDAKDALVSSIGLEATTFVKSTRAQFTGAGNPTTGQGLELTAPDQNTGQIASYDRDNSAYKELRLKGSTVSLYGGTSNALVGTFNSTGLSMESGKTISAVIATPGQPNITSLGTLTGLTIEGALSSNGRASAHGYSCRDNYGVATGIGNGMYSPNVSALGFATNSIERLIIGSDGKLKHDSVGGVAAEFTTASASGAYHKYELGANGNVIGYTGGGAQLVTTGGTDDFAVRAQANLIFSSGGSTERLRITSAGQVEVTGSIKASQGATAEFIQAVATNVGTRAVGSFEGKDSSGNAVTLKMGGYGDTERGEIFTHSNHALGFATNNAATQMALQTDGSLTIGTTTAHTGARLTVDGNFKLTQATSNTRRIYALPGTGAYALNSSGGSAIGFTRNSNNDDFLIFETHKQGASHAERMRLTQDGYMHLGGVSQGTNKVGGQNVTGQDYDPIFKLLTQTNNTWLMQLRSDTSTGSNGIFMRAGSGTDDYTMYLTGNDENNKHLLVRGDGYVQKPKNPGFAVQGTPSSSNFTNYNNSWHSFATVHYNNGSHYDNASGRFTAPIDGYYFFTCGLWCSNSDDSSGSYVLTLLRENSNGGGDITFAGASHRTQNNQLTCSGGIYMTGGQTVRIEFNGSITSSTPRNYFTGCLIG